MSDNESTDRIDLHSYSSSNSSKLYLEEKNWAINASSKVPQQPVLEGRESL